MHPVFQQLSLPRGAAGRLGCRYGVWGLAVVAGPQRRRRLGTGDLRIRLISVCAPNKNQLKKQHPGAIWHRGAILGAEKKDSDASVSESFSQYSTEFIRPGIDKTSNSPSRPRPRGWDGRSFAGGLRSAAAAPRHRERRSGAWPQISPLWRSGSRSR